VSAIIERGNDLSIKQECITVSFGTLPQCRQFPPTLFVASKWLMTQK